MMVSQIPKLVAETLAAFSPHPHVHVERAVDEFTRRGELTPEAVASLRHAVELGRLMGVTKGEAEQRTVAEFLERLRSLEAVSARALGQVALDLVELFPGPLN
jgi:hypothetical protein